MTPTETGSICARSAGVAEHLLERSGRVRRGSLVRQVGPFASHLLHGGTSLTDLGLRWNKVISGDGLLATLGAHHRKQRKLLNPAFAVGHLSSITPLFYDVADKVRLISHISLSEHSNTDSFGHFEAR